MDYSNKVSGMMRDQQDFLSLEQSRKMSEIAASEGNARGALLIKVLAHTGRRVSEVVPQKKYDLKHIKTMHAPYPGLRPMDLDIAMKIAFFTLAKKRSAKPVRQSFPMQVRLMRELLEYRRTRQIPEDKPFFPITRRAVYNIVRKYATKAGVNYPPAMHPHALRHGLGVEMSRRAETPQDIMSIQQQLGHSSLGITQVYMRFSTASLKKLMERTLQEEDK